MLFNQYGLAQELATRLLAGKHVLSVAESCTGGGLAHQLTAVNGSSLWFDAGFVTYSNAAKQHMLAVPESTLDAYGAVSAETAAAMATGVLKNSKANLALSITGIAGPGGGSDEKPVGLVWFGLAKQGQDTEACSAMFAGGRDWVREHAIRFALQWLLETVSG